MTAAEAVAHDLSPKIGSLPARALCVFGDWFGRPYDNQHRCVDARSEGQDLVITFDEGEILRVADPGGWTFDSETFRIDQASSVTWQWHSYGPPPTPANFRTITHIRHGDEVRAVIDHDAELYPFAPTLTRPAVEMPPYPRY